MQAGSQQRDFGTNYAHSPLFLALLHSITSFDPMERGKKLVTKPFFTGYAQTIKGGMGMAQ
jgi:hypothetical protein